jgi:Flp pilus assembly protein TadD
VGTAAGNTSSVMNILGRLLHANKSFVQASERYTQALTLSPDNPR